MTHDPDHDSTDPDPDSTDPDPDSTETSRRSTDDPDDSTGPPTDTASIAPSDAEPRDPDEVVEPPGETDGDSGSSIGASVATYAFRLAFVFLAVVARVGYAGLRLVVAHLRDADSRSRVRRWILLEANRYAVIVGFVVSVFALSLALGVSNVIGVRESRFVTTMFSTMIAGLFSFIPIVVSVNQLIVSRLLGTPDRLTERIDGVRKFRTRVESQTAGDGVSPTDPASFLARLAGTLGERAEALADVCEAADDGTGDTVSSATETTCYYASRTSDHAERLSSNLARETTSVFGAVLPTIDHDYSGAANEARRLRRRFENDFDDRTTGLLSELQELFVTIDAARQYFTSIYLQQELARLSRQITYSGTAAVLLSTLVIMIYASGYPPVAHEGPLLVLVSLTLAVAFSPLAVLFAYVVRISTVLRRNATPGEFTRPGEQPLDD